MVLCRGIGFLCLLFAQCNSYRMFERETQGLHEVEDELNPGTQTRQMFKGVTRFVKGINHMPRNSLFRFAQRNLHLRNGPLKSTLMKELQQMQRYRNLGKYRFSTFPGRKTTLFPQNLLPMVSRRLMSTKEAKRFGKVFKDYMAKREMKDSRIMQQNGKKEGWCTPDQMKEFKERFYGGSAIDGGLSYTHPTSKFTSLYIVTSQAGDHNGAFSGLEAGTNQAGFWNMCARMLRMSSLYNVVYKRVGNLADAIDFVKQVKNDPDFVKDGKALKHVTISGHGSSDTLVLGDDRLRSRELTSGGDTDTKAFLKELKPALIHTGEARSTVFLDSCSTGKTPANGGDPLAQLVADALPGVEVHAFEDISYPKHVALQDNFVKDAEFQCQWSLKGKCLQASVFMSKSDADMVQNSDPEPKYDSYEEPQYYDYNEEPVYGLLELSRSNVSDDDEFVFYDGVSFVADPQTCAEWCGMIMECHSFQFVELVNNDGPDDLDLGMCILKAWPKQSKTPDSPMIETDDTESEIDYEDVD